MSFETAFEIVLGHEGGYSADPQDPGGETKFGVSKRAYPHLDIKNLSIEKAREIYLRDYWFGAGCDVIADEALAILLFDCAVNQGVSRAKLIAAGARTAVEFQAERALHYASLPTFTRYGRGWMRRLFATILQSGAHL